MVKNVLCVRYVIKNISIQFYIIIYNQYIIIKTVYYYEA